MSKQTLMERLRGTSPRYSETTGEHMFDVFNNLDGEEAAARIEAHQGRS